jgi:hypothetical protein
MTYYTPSFQQTPFFDSLGAATLMMEDNLPKRTAMTSGSSLGHRRARPSIAVGFLLE